MSTLSARNNAKHYSIHRAERRFKREGKTRVSDFFGENVFDVFSAKEIPDTVKKELKSVAKSGKLNIKKETAEVIAKAVTEWAIQKGATHFCHWFQPLTGGTAEKHDAFISYEDESPIEKLSASQLMQGEPDASSFPHGGSRSTFEARGYTSWDYTSPMFLIEDENGMTLCIPTAFVSYYGDALDIKTPLLKSNSVLSEQAVKFLNLIGEKDVQAVNVTCGAEQEYFLIDKSFFYSRPDLVMTGRTLFGSLTSKNQQLSDHYFGTIPSRVLSFMQELDHELYKLGIPAKTRHNEVAPGQFEIAQIFRGANVSSDNNQLVMATIKTTAEKHDFVALLHEKPFDGINGSGKHLNWSMATSTGSNLLEPGNEPHQNMRFLAFVAMIIEAVHKHSKILRLAIASPGNDHRLGANEAPPSIISVFLGDTLDKIFSAINDGKEFTPTGDNVLDVGARQLAHLLKDNTDRNRTSPFAFTGNKFEFRAVGSAAAIGFPLSILNSAVAETIQRYVKVLEDDLSKGTSVDKALNNVIKQCLQNSAQVIFNGDGYSEAWVQEAAKRGLPNLKTTADALPVLKDTKETAFLNELGIYRESELETRYNVLVERYNLLREIEFNTLIDLIQQNIIPSCVDYKEKLARVVHDQKQIGLECSVEKDILKKLSFHMESLYALSNNLTNGLTNLESEDQKRADMIAHELFPISQDIAALCNQVEQIIPNNLWSLPKYYDMLFLR